MLRIMCGFPGSGKSTYLKNHFSATANEVILCPDEFRFELTGQQYHGPAEDMVWSHVKIAARVLLKGKYDVIIDGTHLTRASRGSWIRIAKEMDVGVMCRWQNVSPDIAVQRNKDRPQGHIVPEKVMDRMIKSFVRPTPEEGFFYVEVCE